MLDGGCDVVQMSVDPRIHKLVAELHHDKFVTLRVEVLVCAKLGLARQQCQVVSLLFVAFVALVEGAAADASTHQARRTIAKGILEEPVPAVAFQTVGRRRAIVAAGRAGDLRLHAELRIAELLLRVAFLEGLQTVAVDNPSVVGGVIPIGVLFAAEALHRIDRAIVEASLALNRARLAHVDVEVVSVAATAHHRRVQFHEVTNA